MQRNRETMNDKINRPITDSELALLQMVVDARDDPKRMPDATIRTSAQRVAVEAVAADVMEHLQSLYNAKENAEHDFNVALDELPPYARRSTLATLERTYRSEE